MSGLVVVIITLMVVLILLCLVLFYVRHKPHKLPPPHHEAQLLKERYSRGELSEEEYRKRVQELGCPPPVKDTDDR
ncbi:SHOCT domain-containing protein [Planococcus sp. ISL-109]|uniref:SHOCT domain-containing protein n=1 Tax=Planococcus sp. ISL-109 TaxID=2819166 RepID=UPI001BE7CD31|nr:SHOCT domain-containing protein [Planococcus sp. ISL-109]MBT2583890.1 SHOCT domain-containing protein [Planococcus sp. ISL-109]